ncbi:MAG: AGE family epimerase/isomerase [Ancalomicrobiaceae bacterium]|nr:AGE family epimerase/isomerase [Ancalomicrobiaceae bacterium]
MDRPDAFSDMAALSEQSTAWLFDAALPLWWCHGIDRVNGGFHEVLGLDGRIIPTERRVRVTARQIFAFALAGKLGWHGDWRGAVDDGLAYFFRACVLPSGAVRKLTNADGSPKDDTFCLYDQAFALFALAEAASMLNDRAPVEAAAVKLRDLLIDRYKNPVAGFEEANPRSLPLKANPHMHLFEACLAWEEVGGDATWSRLADEIAELCLSRLIDRRTGWLKEYFDGDWIVMAGDPGRICEPGHQFEWSWLLTRWGTARRRPEAIAAARTLTALAEAHGINRREQMAIMEITDDGRINDGTARLWSQTERLKSNLALADVAADAAERDRYLATAVTAGRALLRFLDVETPGLWRDRMQPDGCFDIEPAPASSFYHIIYAIDQLRGFVAACPTSAFAP